MTSPYAFYQFWLNADDADVVRYLKIFTFLDRGRIAELEAAVTDRPAAREAQRVLAAEVTTLVHGAEATERVRNASLALFGRGALTELDAATVADAVAELPRASVRPGVDSVLDLLAATGLVDGTGAARRTIADGGAYLNNVKVVDPGRIVLPDDLIAGRWALVRRGRRALAVVDAGSSGA